VRDADGGDWHERATRSERGVTWPMALASPCGGPGAKFCAAWTPGSAAPGCWAMPAATFICAGMFPGAMPPPLGAPVCIFIQAVVVEALDSSGLEAVSRTSGEGGSQLPLAA